MCFLVYSLEIHFHRNFFLFQGDSGGAIVLDGKVVGIVSFGPDCAAPNLPGSYTKISKFGDFIKSTIEN